MLEIADLAKRYGKVVALDGATFDGPPGRLVGFLGPNGAGKTTTMRCVFGLARPDRGQTPGRAADRPRDRLRFGYMPEQRGLYPRMRVAEQLSYFAQHHGLSGRDADAAAVRWLERLGLADRAQVEARGAVARQPAAGPARRGARPRSGAAGPRRAVLGPRPDRHRDDVRGPPGAGRGRRRRPLLEPPARPRRGHLRGRRDHRPRPDRRRRRDRRASRRRPDAATSRSRWRAPAARWLDGRPELDVVETEGRPGEAPRRPTTSTSRGLLAAASAAGPVRRFAFQPPALSELFMEAVQS